MDFAGVIAQARFDKRPIKEPRGFIKIIQFVTAIFAFATTSSQSGHYKYTITCNDSKSITQMFEYSYPFRLDDHSFTKQCADCDNKDTTHPYGDFAPSAQFFVFVGVMAFLYILGIMILYMFFDEAYQQNERIPKVDFVIHVVFTVLWLICSAAWAQGVVDLKYYSQPKEFFHRVPDCSNYNMGTPTCNATCTQTTDSNFANVNVSLIFGFLNMVIWGGNLWFLWKETTWFTSRYGSGGEPQQPQDVPGAMPTTPQTPPAQDPYAPPAASMDDTTPNLY